MYGFTSTATHYSLVRFEPKNPESTTFEHEDYTISESFRFMFGQMKQYKASWLKNCTLFIRILYTILYERLDLANKRKI